MDEDWLARLLPLVGRPRPCDICGAPVPSADLAEGLAPGCLVTSWDVIVHRAVWVCPACPAP